MSSHLQNPAQPVDAPDGEAGPHGPSREGGEAGELGRPRAAAAWRPDGEFYALDPNYVAAEQIGSWISTLVITVIIGAVLAIAPFAGWLSGWSLLLVIIAALAFLVLTGWLAVQYPRWEYKHIRYAVSETGIEIHRGILWRRIVNVPRSRIQHTDVVQGPLARRYGIATLQVYTAGTENNEVDLEGLSYDVALSIRDYLVGESRSHDR